MQAGYRWFYSDYKTGSGLNLFRYDVWTQGHSLARRFILAWMAEELAQTSSVSREEVL